MAQSSPLVESHISERMPLLGEDKIGLAAAARQFPGYRTNKHVNPTTLLRWLTRGVKSPNGPIVKLEAVRVGYRWLTSVKAIERFVVALTPTANVPASAVESPAQRAREADAASAELDAVGI